MLSATAQYIYIEFKGVNKSSPAFKRNIAIPSVMRRAFAWAPPLLRSPPPPLFAKGAKREREREREREIAGENSRAVKW